MYKVGDKFIIEIEESCGADGFSQSGVWGVKGFSLSGVREETLNLLEKYAPSNTDYEKGLSDAWECARKIKGLTYDEEKEIFDVAFPLEKYTPQTAIEKLKAWEEKQEIKVGDVIDVKDMGLLVVTHDFGGGIYDCLVIENLTGYTVAERNVFKKTGKHIDLTEIFKGLEVED